MIAEYLGLERSAGLTTALIGKADVNDLLQPWGSDELYVLAAGQVPPNPSELLGSEKMKQLIVRLESVFDAVIIDAPPLLAVTDAAVLAQQVGGVVVVVGAQKVRTTDLEKSLAALEMVKADLIGVVLNRLPAKGPDAYSYGYYRYESAHGPAGVEAKLGSPSVNSEPGLDDQFAREILHGNPREATRLSNATSRERSAR
jgi:capsular exopolysaccharide synthesis family protein